MVIVKLYLDQAQLLIKLCVHNDYQTKSTSTYDTVCFADNTSAVLCFSAQHLYPSKGSSPTV